MLFLTLSGTDIDFLGWELQWRTYTTKKALLTTKHVKLIDKKEFSATALDLKSKTFIIYIISLSSIASANFSPPKLNVHPSRKPQISNLIVKKALTKVFAEYSDFVDVFSPDLTSEFFKHIRINNHGIELVDG